MLAIKHSIFLMTLSHGLWCYTEDDQCSYLLFRLYWLLYFQSFPKENISIHINRVADPDHISSDRKIPMLKRLYYGAKTLGAIVPLHIQPQSVKGLLRQLRKDTLDLRQQKHFFFKYVSSTILFFFFFGQLICNNTHLIGTRC